MSKEPTNWSRYSQVGFQMFFTIAAGTWLGVWLDAQFGTKPILTLVLILSSIFLAIYNVIRLLPKS